MTNDERARLNLFERLSEVLTPPDADTLMELLPPVGWADVATRGDIEHCRDVLRTEVRSVEARLVGSAAEIRGEMTALRTEVRSDLERQRATTNQTISDLGVQLRAELATKDDLTAIRANMATKADLTAIRADMATKDDLTAIRANMATKDDLTAIRADMATKDDLTAIRADMATKADLTTATTAIRADMATKADLKAIRADMATKADLTTATTAIRADMATKADLKAIRADMATGADLTAIRADMATGAGVKAALEIALSEHSNRLARELRNQLLAIFSLFMATWGGMLAIVISSR